MATGVFSRQVGNGIVIAFPLTTSANDAIDDLKTLCGALATNIREQHRAILDTNKATETTLVWLVSLMGAGIFSVQAFLSAAPLSVRLTTLVPWTLGVILAMIGRLLSNHLLSTLHENHHSLISILDLLRAQTDKTTLLKGLDPIIRALTSPGGIDQPVAMRLAAAANVVFYLTHIALVVGTVAAATTIIVWTKT